MGIFFGEDGATENVPCRLLLFYHQKGENNDLSDSEASDRNYTAMRTHMRWSVHLSALLITWFTWGDGLQRRYASDVAFCIVRFPLTVDNSDMN
jgi:hypothetical protein